MLHQTAPKGLPYFVVLVALATLVAIQLAALAMASAPIIPAAAPAAVIASSSTATLTPSPTATPTPDILNPVWVEMPLPENMMLAVGIDQDQENGALYLAGVTPGSIDVNALWMSVNEGNSWELLQESPSGRFASIFGPKPPAISIRTEGNVQMTLEGDMLDWVLRMSQDSSKNWISIQLPPVKGFMPLDPSYDFAVKNSQVVIWVAGGPQIWQTTIKLP